MKKVWIMWIAALWLITGWPLWCHGAEIEDSELYARAACLMDADSGRILFGKEEKKPMPMASTTKVMTCILALEMGHADEVVTVSENAAAQPKVRMGAKAGEQFLLHDLLYALMLNSDNDAAVMVAEHISGSVEAFAERMNLKAREIGCEDTYFITPNGLDGKDEYGIHHTTAADLARILRYCIVESPQKEMFLEITRMPSYTFWNQEHSKMYNCINHNTFLTMMDGALTGKTGFTADAGYCYVGALTDGGRTFIVSLLACGWPNNKGYKWMDVKKLMTYGLQNYEYRDIFEHGELGALRVTGGQSENMDIGKDPVTKIGYGGAEREMTFPLLLRKDEIPRVVYEIPEKLEAPVKKGEQIGKVQYFLEDELLREYPVYALSGVEVLDFGWCLRKVEEKYRV